MLAPRNHSAARVPARFAGVTLDAAVAQAPRHGARFREAVAHMHDAERQRKEWELELERRRHKMDLHRMGRVADGGPRRSRTRR